jgi:hypothetical protein
MPSSLFFFVVAPSVAHATVRRNGAVRARALTAQSVLSPRPVPRRKASIEAVSEWFADRPRPEVVHGGVSMGTT